MKRRAEEKLIGEEYKQWMNNVPNLYNLAITQLIEWPSITVEWLPDWREPSGKDYAVQTLVLGTQTMNNEPNYLLLVQVELPLKDEDSEVKKEEKDYEDGDADEGADGDDNDATYEDEANDDGSPKIILTTAANSKVHIIQQITHDGHVHRARYMPQNPSIIATKTESAEVYMFDSRKHPSFPIFGGTCTPDLRLKGHSAGGFGLSWSRLKHGHLLSGSDDSKICLWDINVKPENQALDAFQTFEAHEGIVEDVAWHQRHEYLFGSVGEDQHLHVWDLRSPSVAKPSQTVVAHESEVNCLSFNHFNEWVVLTGSSDQAVKLFDLRRLSTAVHTFKSHNEEVYQVGWSPEHESIFASCSHDRRLLVWDISRIGEVQTPEDAEEGPPELLFIHGGHTDKISDFSWNPCEDWVVASVADDNMLHIWQMADYIYLDYLLEDDLPKDFSTKGILNLPSIGGPKWILKLADFGSQTLLLQNQSSFKIVCCQGLKFFVLNVVSNGNHIGCCKLTLTRDCIMDGSRVASTLKDWWA